MCVNLYFSCFGDKINLFTHIKCAVRMQVMTKPTVQCVKVFKSVCVCVQTVGVI